jgi:hypothetical protein
MLTVEHINPPIPVRDFDYSAYVDPEGIVGWGKTPEEAIQDYHMQVGQCGVCGEYHDEDSVPMICATGDGA